MTKQMLLMVSRQTLYSVEISKFHRLFRWTSWLHPSRWLRKKVKHGVSGASAPVIPPINVGDRLFLETLVRHAEASSYSQSRTSTMPLLNALSETPTFESFHRSSLPPGIVPEVESHTVSSERCQPLHNDRGLLHSPSTPAAVERSPSRNNGSFLLLRSPHPPSSYIPVSEGIFRSRLSSQSRCSTATSCYDPRDFPISSFSESIISGTASPLFYQPTQTSPPNSPPSPISSAKAIRRKSNRISSHNVSPVQPISRTGSLTVSITTEDGIENLEFPSPPRWSGCWFSDRVNNQTPRSPTTGNEQSGDSSGGYDVDDIATTIRALAQVSEESLSDSNSESTSTSALAIPHMRTFGPHATSFLSLRAHGRSQQPVTVASKLVSAPMTCNFGDIDGNHEEMESICSAFADVSLSSAVTFDRNDTGSDAVSFADSLVRVRV